PANLRRHPGEDEAEASFQRSGAFDDTRFARLALAACVRADIAAAVEHRMADECGPAPRVFAFERSRRAGELVLAYGFEHRGRQLLLEAGARAGSWQPFEVTAVGRAERHAARARAGVRSASGDLDAAPEFRE